MILDSDTFIESNVELESGDPIGFPDSELSEEEEFEFRCLEYEYELNYFYKFIHPESQMAEVINYILGSLNGILFQANLHQRIKKLTERIFIVGIKAAEEQALELMNLKIIPNQLAWLWEAYAEEYVKRGKFRKAFQYYWYAMDIYLFVTENEDEDEQKRIFYDGSSFLYISDIIYRIYNKATKQCHCWEECIKEFLKRWEKLKAYNYSYLYLVLDGELRETQTTDYFSKHRRSDCAVRELTAR